MAENSGASGGTGLPASIEAAWGLRERPVKGPKPGLSLERIVAAAVALAASEGLAAVSMGRIAKELGASTMLEAGGLGEPDAPGYEFTFGLERILDGVEALIPKGPHS